ncbi:MAG: hypothetical protein MJ132_08490, partial [Clostridia bacterium]|nr:hypothetical protein [Clostridia bacterium]
MTSKITPGSLIWSIIKVIVYIAMVLCAFSFVAIFVWVLINSFKLAPDFMQNALGLPKMGWDFKNYVEIFDFTYKSQNLLQMLGNTMIIMAISIFCTISFPVMAGYVFGRMNFKGRDKFEAFLYVLMTIPIIG